MAVSASPPDQVGPAHHIAVLVDQRGVPLEGVEGGGDRGQLGVVHLHQGGDLLQLLLLLRGHHGQHVAHIPGDIPLRPSSRPSPV